MINLVDLYATFQEMVSGEVLSPEEAAADSYSFYDELRGERKEEALRPHMIVNETVGMHAIRKGPWKYIEGVAAAPLSDKRREDLRDLLKPQLYNLEEDLSETTNLIGLYPEVQKELQETLDKIRSEGSERLIP
jgi:arylsulfatase A-like enzyme